jgi:hypothetical protein
MAPELAQTVRLGCTNLRLALQLAPHAWQGRLQALAPTLARSVLRVLSQAWVKWTAAPAVGQAIIQVAVELRNVLHAQQEVTR